VLEVVRYLAELGGDVNTVDLQIVVNGVSFAQ